MIKGIFPPIPTPFHDGEFSGQNLVENLDRWNEQPLDGYIVLGSNGEAPLLDERERHDVVRTVRGRMKPGRTLIVGAGRESTRATIRSVNEAFDLGADAVLVGVPTYYRPMMTDVVLREHFLKVAEASPGPVILYSVPHFTDLPIGRSLFADLIGHEKIAGIKESSGDLQMIADLVAEVQNTRRDLSILVGSAGIFAEGLRLGACGGILAVAAIAGGILSKIVRNVEQERYEEAQRINRSLDPLTLLVTRQHGIGGLKAAMDLLHLHGGDPRSPLLPAGPAARAEIAALMDDLGLLA